MSTVVSRDGTHIAFERSGQGHPVILVDGAFCYRGLGPMGKLAPLLAERFTVYTYDRRGRGESGDGAPYAVEREIDDLDALITEAGGSANVFGMSSGAVLALEAAASGLSIDKLALYEPPFMDDEDRRRRPADHQAQLVGMIATGRHSDAVRFYMTKVIGMPAMLVTAMRLFPMWKKLQAVAPSLRYDSAVLGDFSLPVQRVASIRTPTLVAGGAKSPPLLRDAVAAVASTLPNAQHRLLAGQTHNFSAKALAPVLAGFFWSAGIPSTR